MDVVSVCPLRVASLLWQPRRGSWAQTVVCKATYRLGPSTSVLDRDQEYPSEEDNHWNDDAARSLHSSSDLVPYKPSPEVMLVGHAFAPRGEPVSRLIARFIVGEVDKLVEVCADESFAQDGSLREGPRFTKMPLRYERAAGGPETSNPVGMRLDAPNMLGIVQIPNLRPVGTNVTSRSDYIAPVGFGPIAQTWPARQERLGALAGRWSLSRLASEPMPDGLDPAYFMSAPRDQALSALRPNERIILENLHAEHPRLATNLPGFRPRAFVQGAHAPWELELTCDTLWIDTDQALATLTWRGRFHLDAATQSGRVVVAMDTSDKPITWSDVEPLCRALPPPAPPPVADSQTRGPVDSQLPKPTLPFALASRASMASMASGIHSSVVDPATAEPAPAPPVARDEGSKPRQSTVVFAQERASQTGGPAWLRGSPPNPTPSAVSFPELTPHPHPVVQVAPPAVVARPPLASPWAQQAAQQAPLAQPLTFGQASAADPLVAPKPSIAITASVVASAPATSAASVASPAPAWPPRRSGTEGAPEDARPRADAGALRDATSRGVVDASNAAALAGGASTADPPARKSLAPSAQASDPRAAPQTPGEHADLLWFDARAMPAIRAEPALALDTRSAGSTSWIKADASAKTEAQEAVDRRDILRVMTRVRPLDEAGVADAVSRAFRDDGSFKAPIVVVAGELAVSFDELERLRATVTAATPFVGGDKKLKEALASATEALAAPHELPSDVAEGLATRVEEAFVQGARAVAAGYLQTNVERLLVRGRRYQKVTLFGEPRLRALLSFPGGGAPVPAYLPEPVGPLLPLFRRFRARAIVEVRGQEDQFEPHPDALSILALARLLRAR